MRKGGRLSADIKFISHNDCGKNGKEILFSSCAQILIRNTQNLKQDSRSTLVE